MRALSASAMALAAGALGFALGARLASTHGWGSDGVSTTVVNAGPAAIERAYVRFESCGLQGTAIIGRLEPGHARTVRYSVCGEGSYRIEANLADGRTLQSDGGYVERGYRTEDIVDAERIASSQSVY